MLDKKDNIEIQHFKFVYIKYSIIRNILKLVGN